MLKIQIITSQECELCKAFLKRLAKLDFTEFQEYSADDLSNKSQLDQWRIVDMPVVQIVNDDGKEIYRFPYSEKGYSPRSMKYKRDELQDKEALNDC